MTKQIKIRCSSLPRIMACPASAKLPDVQIDTSSDESNMGTVAHEIFARIVNGEIIDQDEIVNVASKHGVEYEELQFLIMQFKKLWAQLSPLIESPLTELEFSRTGDGFVLTGHIDMIGYSKDDPSHDIIIDWKTGHAENNPVNQLKGYAVYCVTNPSHEKTKTITVITAWVRLGFTEVARFGREEIEAFFREVQKTVSLPVDQRKFSPSSETCRYCPRRHDCPGRRAMLEGAMRDVIAISGEGASNEITSTQLASLYPKSRLLKKALENYEDQLKQAVQAAGGTLPFPGGELTLEESLRKTIVFNPGVLSAFLSNDQLEALRPTVKKKDLERAVMENAPRGKKAALRDEVFEILEAAGSIETTTVQTMTYKEKKNDE